MSISPAKRREAAKEICRNVADEHKYEGLKVDYDYENLVLEGGGAKGNGYAGALKALEDLGILQKIKRFGGTSVGAYTALLLAVGASAEDLVDEACINLKSLSCDGKLGILNMFMGLGINPGKRLFKHIHDVVERFTGKADLTFEELYKLRGVELCVVVCNLTNSSTEYCHAKTTPNLPIAQAVKMSMSLPLLFEPWRTRTGTSDGLQTDQWYIDGGVLLNYPIRAFDGWFLSMKPEHSFLHMIQSGKGMFEDENKKTLGLKVFDAKENDTDELIYLRRYGDENQERPNTSLAREKKKDVDKFMEKKMMNLRIADASGKFLKFLKKCDTNENGTISLPELKAGLRNIGVGARQADEVDWTVPADEASQENKEFSLTDWRLLFEANPLEPSQTVEEIFAEMDQDNDKEADFNEVVAYMSKRGVPMRRAVMESGCCTHRPHIHSLTQFIEALTDTYGVAIGALTKLPGEHKRTIGIYTDYIATVDMEQELGDAEFIIKQGWLAAVYFLKEKVKEQTV